MQTSEDESRHIDNQRLESLQALRALAFLGIFFVHAQFFVQWSALGVSVFYVMSGFLMMYKYGSKELSPSFRNNAFFSLKKIRKLYPLHFLTMILIIFLQTVIVHNRKTLKWILEYIGKIVLNVTLTQSWFPDSGVNTSLNGVAWYLSVTMFLYFIFPWLQTYIRKSKLSVLFIISGIILCLQISLCVPFIHFFGKQSPIYKWFMYCFPAFRLGDFFAGCVIERFYFERKFHEITVLRATLYEIMATVFTVGVFHWLRSTHYHIISRAFQNWTSLYIPIASIWVCLFVMNKGIITKIFVNKLFIFIGDINAYNFLIHYVVILYVRSAINYYHLEINWINRSVLVTIELLISILLSIGYKKIHENGLFPPKARNDILNG